MEKAKAQKIRDTVIGLLQDEGIIKEDTYPTEISLIITETEVDIDFNINYQGVLQVFDDNNRGEKVGG